MKENIYLKQDLQVKQIKNKKIILDFLLKDKYWSVEAFVGLRAENFILGNWYGVFDKNDKIKSIYLIFKCLSPMPVFSLGDISGLNLIADKLNIEGDIYIQAKFNHIEYLTSQYTFNHNNNTLLMKKCGLNKSFSDKIEKLAVSNYPEMKKLYATAEDQIYFDRDHIKKGIYYGIRRDGILVSMAGTHVLDRQNKIVMLGDIVTHPAYRGRGFAMICCAAVCNDLNKWGYDICVKVREYNYVAINMYKSLGFVKYNHFYEGAGIYLKTENKDKRQIIIDKR